jgi:hypothetical protein
LFILSHHGNVQKETVDTYAVNNSKSFKKRGFLKANEQQERSSLYKELRCKAVKDTQA